MSGRHTTVKADPPPNLLYDMRASARIERWEARAEAFFRFYVFAGATAGIGALVLAVLRCR